MQLFVDSNHLSPYAMSAFVALCEKGIPFERVLIDLSGKAHLSEAYGRVSTTLRVPSILDDGFSLSESSAICEYLNDQFPDVPVYPDNVQQRAKAREIQAWLRSDLMALRQERPTEVIFLRQHVQALSAAGIEAANKLISAAEKLIPDGQQSLFGQWCIADTDLALMLNRLVSAGDSVPPRLLHYVQVQWQRPSVQEWANMPRPSC
ncbi:MAG: hypothetical protein RI907_1111 [Pseudomonadota bacterium]|jgi:glutathione S-transferase